MIDGLSQANTFADGVAEGMKTSKTSFRIKHGDNISPKNYSSGWGGGSRGKIKTYKYAKLGARIGKVTGPLGVGFVANDIRLGLEEDGYRPGKNTAKAFVRNGASYGMAFLGAKAGACFGPIGVGVGAVIGGLIGGLIC